LIPQNIPFQQWIISSLAFAIFSVRWLLQHFFSVFFFSAVILPAYIHHNPDWINDSHLTLILFFFSAVISSPLSFVQIDGTCMQQRGMFLCLEHRQRAILLFLLLLYSEQQHLHLRLDSILYPFLGVSARGSSFLVAPSLRAIAY
jgi:hypothetical protein